MCRGRKCITFYSYIAWHLHELQSDTERRLAKILISFFFFFLSSRASFDNFALQIGMNLFGVGICSLPPREVSRRNLDGRGADGGVAVSGRGIVNREE